MRSLIAIKLGAGRQLALRNPDTLKKVLTSDPLTQDGRWAGWAHEL